ncbi:Cu(I)-responsive transcriptional regulator [Vibrio mediterranei]|uniref:Cu(I)-responsive transcriptional regulator n=1 Tax=Vibrio mediterranei TaxID=689 RepID=UPI00148C019B|nr:Cu(I)-responsive transcriptional regulator [Vibrio mediterranei]NOH27581.1 Cu(I)-responsive transcriptional regulator [Vibrio mediterranei]
MNISEVAKKTGLTTKSIRLYEEKKIISSPLRSNNGYRIYSAKHVDELSVVAKAKRVGFTLDECRDMVSLAFKTDRTSAEVKRRTSEKLAEVKRKISELQAIEQQLEVWLSQCPGDTNSACPIVDDLMQGCNTKVQT